MEFGNSIHSIIDPERGTATALRTMLVQSGRETVARTYIMQESLHGQHGEAQQVNPLSPFILYNQHFRTLNSMNRTKILFPLNHHKRKLQNPTTSATVDY